MDANNELRVRHFPKDLKADLRNISANLGVSLSNFVKVKLRDVANNFPPEKRTPPRKDD